MATRLGLLCCVLLALPGPADGGEAGKLQITYVGNEGFLVQGGGKKVLVDALYRKGVRGYHIISQQTRALSENAKAPFDGVDLILATHYHADHFDAGAVAAHLINNPRAVFISTHQSRKKLEPAIKESPELSQRVRALYPEEGHPVEMDVNGIKVTIINLHHGRGRPGIENLGFIVELGGQSFLHVGDTEANAADFSVYDLKAKKIDVAFLPMWQLRHEAWAGSAEAVGARKIVIMHVPSAQMADAQVEKQGGWEQVVAGIQARTPGSLFFDAELDQKSIEPGTQAAGAGSGS